MTNERMTAERLAEITREVAPSRYDDRAADLSPTEVRELIREIEALTKENERLKKRFDEHARGGICNCIHCQGARWERWTR